MLPLLGRFFAFALVAATVALEPKHVEIDIIFPRNETYLPSTVFPIALAVQNLTHFGLLGNYTFSWAITSITKNNVPTGLEQGGGEFPIPKDASGPVILVANNNVSSWIDRKNRGERYALQWNIGWDGLYERCPNSTSGVFGELHFSVEAPWEAYPNATEALDRGKGKPPDVLQVPECPILGELVDISPNATASSCPGIEEYAKREGNPCAVKIDKAVASSIYSRAASLATATPSPTRTRVLSTPTEDAGVARPLQTAIAAACFLGSLVFTSCA